MSRVLKNILFLVSGQTINLLLNLISLSLAARYLGVELFGKFSAMLAIVTILAKTFDFGFPSIVFRELSLKPKDYEYLNSALTATLISYLIVTFLTNLLMLIWSFSKVEILLINFLLFNSILSAKFNNIRELLNTPFKVNLRMIFPMMILVLDNLIFLVVVLVMPLFNGGLNYFIVGYVFSNLPGFLLIIFLLHKEFNFHFKFEVSKVKWLFSVALPLYGYLIVDSLFQQVDILLVKYFHSNFDVGIYSVAIRLVLPLLVIPYAIIQTVFPRIVQNINLLRNENDRIIKVVYKILFCFAVLISIMFTFKSDEIIYFLFGYHYSNSSIPTTILFWTQIFVFYNYFAINLFLAYDKQAVIFKFGMIVLVTNILFNSILIPQYSFLGASISKLLAGLSGSLFIILIQYKLKFKIFYFENKMVIWLLIVLTIGFLLGNLSLIFYLLLLIPFFMIAVILVKYFQKEEVILILELLNNPKFGNYLLKLY